MPGGTTLARLVDEFVATMYQHGIAIERQTVEEEMRERITDISVHLRADAETVLREHASHDWGRKMATDVIEQIRNERLLDTGEQPSVAGAQVASATAASATAASPTAAGRAPASSAPAVFRLR